MGREAMFTISYNGESTDTKMGNCGYGEAIEALQQGIVRLFAWISENERDRYFRLLGRFQDFIIEALPDAVDATIQHDHEEAHCAALAMEADDIIQEVAAESIDEDDEV